MAARAVTAKHVGYTADIADANLGDWLWSVLAMPADHVTIQLNHAGGWSWLHNGGYNRRETHVTALTISNLRFPAKQVQIAHSLISYLAGCDSLRLINFRNVTVGNQVLALLHKTRQQLKLPFCAVTYTECQLMVTAWPVPHEISSAAQAEQYLEAVRRFI